MHYTGTICVYQKIKNNYRIHLTESFLKSAKKISVITGKTSDIYDRQYLQIIRVHPAVS